MLCSSRVAKENLSVLHRPPHGQTWPKSVVVDARAACGRGAAATAGSLVATNIIVMQIASFIMAPISSAAYSAYGIGFISSLACVLLLLIAIPSCAFLYQFTEKPSKGCLAVKQPSQDDGAKAAKDPEAKG